MSKVTVTGKESKFNPIPDQVGVAQALGLIPATSGNNVFSVDEQQSRTNDFSSINLGEYGDAPNSLLSSDQQVKPLLDEQRAQNQSTTEQLLKGLGRIGTTIGTEVLKTPGYLGGAVAGLLPGNDFIQSAVDNAWVNTFESLDQGIKDAMPIYLKKEVEEGGIGRKLLSSAWWSTTGADGIGFLLSMYVPGQAVKALGLGARIGEGLEALAKETKLAKVLTATNILKEDAIAGAKMTAKGIGNIDSSLAVGLNTYIESASEAANTFDTVKKSYLQQHPEATEEEINKVAGDAASGVMKANVGTLLISNYLDELFLFKGFGNSAEKAAKDSVFGKILSGGKIGEDTSKLVRQGFKEWAKDVPGKLAANFAKEGLFEEGLQTEIQKHYEDKASGKTKASFLEDVVGNYFEDLFTDPAMQESVVLGGILGGGASMVSTASEMKARNNFLFGQQASTPSFFGKILNRKATTESTGFANLLQQNLINSTRTIHDIAKTGEDGKPIYADGKIVIDEDKLKAAIEQKQSLVTINQLHNIATLEGNKAEQDQWGDLLTFNYFMPFLQQEGGYEALKGHIDNQLVDLMAIKESAATGVEPTQESKDALKTKLQERAKNYHKIFEDVKATTNTELSVGVDNPDTYTKWNSQVRDRKLQSAVAYDSAQRRLDEITTRFPFIDSELNDDLTKNLSPQDFLDFVKAKSDNEEYGKRAKMAKDEYVRLSNKKTLQEDYKQFKQDQVDLAEAIGKEVEKDNKNVDDALDRQAKTDEFESTLKASGYNTLTDDAIGGFYVEGERALLQDKDGKRATLTSVADATNKTIHHVLGKADGSNVRVTDDNGVFTKEFLEAGYTPVAKEVVDTEVAEVQKSEDAQDKLNALTEVEQIKPDEVTVTTLSEFKDLVKQLYTDSLNKRPKAGGFQGKIDKGAVNKTLANINDLKNTLAQRITFLSQSNLLVNVDVNSEVANSIDNASKLDTLQSLLNGYLAATDTSSIPKDELAEALTPEQLYDLENKITLASKQTAELYNTVKDINLDDSSYNKLEKQIEAEIAKQSIDLSNQIVVRGLDPSQIQPTESFDEPSEQADMRKIFLQHSLPSTPFSTTGISVLYNKQGKDKGKDQIDAEGYPVLNDNEFQKNWFLTIDRLADSIADYHLVPIYAKYDSSDETQRHIEANFPDNGQRTAKDVFVFLHDKNGNQVIENGLSVFTSVRKVDEVFPLNAEPRVIADWILNNYGYTIGLQPMTYESKDGASMANVLIADIPMGKQARAALQPLIENNGTGSDLLRLATEYARKQYDEFIDSLIANKDKVLKVEDVTNGYPLYQLDPATGKRIDHSPMTTFDEIKLQPNIYGKDQLKGAKLGVVVNNQIKQGDRFISIPEGSTYLQFDNEEFITLQSRNLNEDESKTIMFLLSQAVDNPVLNTITIPLPNSTDAYILGNQKIEGSLPVFFRKSQNGGQSFSLLETLINYGLRDKSKNKKGEIYIDNGVVVFTDFKGIRNVTSLLDVKQTIERDFKNPTENVTKLMDFLGQKRVNVHNTLLANNPKYYNPTLVKDKNGYKIDFKTDQTYYEHLLNNVLTTTATKKEGYPDRLQRNVVYNNELVDLNPPVAKLDDAVKPAILSPAQKLAMFQAQSDQLDNEPETSTVVSTKEDIERRRREELKAASDKVNPDDYGFDDADAYQDAMTNVLANQYQINTKYDAELAALNNQSTKPEVTTPKKETVKEKLARIKAESKPVELKNNPTADKAVDDLIEYYIENKIVERKCK